MTDRPIIFSGPMVRAILGGRKTQTRRVLTRKNVTVLGYSWASKSHPWEGLRFDEVLSAGERLRLPFCHPDDEPTPSEECGIYSLYPVIEDADRLWVRETWKPHSAFARMKPSDVPPSNIFYRADDRYAPSNTPWVPSIYMPRWASRLTLKVTGVEVERVQEISEEDAKAEGCEPTTCANVLAPKDGFPSYRSAFAILWNSINAKRGYGWEENPWVVAITFEVIKANIDQLPEAA